MLAARTPDRPCAERGVRPKQTAGRPAGRKGQLPAWSGASGRGFLRGDAFSPVSGKALGLIWLSLQSCSASGPFAFFPPLKSGV